MSGTNKLPAFVKLIKPIIDFLDETNAEGMTIIVTGGHNWKVTFNKNVKHVCECDNDVDNCDCRCHDYEGNT